MHELILDGFKREMEKIAGAGSMVARLGTTGKMLYGAGVYPNSRGYNTALKIMRGYKGTPKYTAETASQIASTLNKGRQMQAAKSVMAKGYKAAKPIVPQPQKSWIVRG